MPTIRSYCSMITFDYDHFSHVFSNTGKIVAGTIVSQALLTDIGILADASFSELDNASTRRQGWAGVEGVFLSIKQNTTNCGPNINPHGIESPCGEIKNAVIVPPKVNGRLFPES